MPNAESVTMPLPHSGRSSSLLGDEPLSKIWRRGSQAVSDADWEGALVEYKNQDVDSSAILGRLASKSEELLSLPTKDVIDLGREMLETIHTRSYEWSVAGSWTIHEARVFELCSGSAEEGHSIPSVAQARASESRYILGNVMSTFLNTLIEALTYDQSRTEVPKFLQNVRSVSTNDKDTEFSVYGPASVGLLPGHGVELWASPDDIEKDDKVSSSVGTVTVVLGAGNQPTPAIIDTLQCCLVRREVVLLKHHPLRPHLIAPYEVLLEPLIRRGYLHQVLDDGIPETTKILSNSCIGHVHLTGSLQTDKAVRATLAKARPSLKESQILEMVTSELGCSTPWIIAPGSYSETELTHAARMIVAGKKTNGGCNCLAAQAVVIPSEWAQKDDLRQKIVDELQRQPTHPCYYPGSRDRRESIKEAYEAIGGPEKRSVIVEASSVGVKENPKDHVVLVECGTPGRQGYDDTALVNEAFGPVLALVELPGGDQDNYLVDVAVPFLNNKKSIYGSLSCSIIAAKSSNSESVGRAIAALEYGSINLNTFGVVGYIGLLVGGTWGAHPNDKSRQSGHGVVGNLYGIRSPMKTVVRGPPLTTTPIFDLAKLPPAIVFDALHAAMCAPSAMHGFFNLMVLLFLRFLSAIFSPFLRLTHMGSKTSKPKQK